MESVQESRSVSDAPDNDLASLRLKVTQLETQLKDEAESKQLQKEQVSVENEAAKVLVTGLSNGTLKPPPPTPGPPP